MFRSRFMGRVGTRMGASRALVGVLVLATTASGVFGVTAAGARTTAPVKPVTSRADRLSAMASAQKQKSRVQITGETTGNSLTWANPDGTITSQLASAPVRFKNGDDAWTDIDTDLTYTAGGDLAPAAYPEPVAISSGGGTDSATQDLVRIGEGKSTLAWQWQGALPQPTVLGNRATYANVRPGVDLVVEARLTGVEQFFVLRNRPVSTPDLSLPVRLGADVNAVAKADGSIDYKTDKGKTIATTPLASMWSSVGTDDFRKPTAPPHNLRAKLGRRIHAKVETTEPGDVQTNADAPVIDVTPADATLQDPNTQYPLVVDPSVNLGYDTRDTFVEAASPTYNGNSDAYMYAGNFYSAASRSLINWDVTSIRGKKVTAATLHVYNMVGQTSPYDTWQVWRTGLATASTTWNAQPTWTANDESSTSHNGTSAGWMTASVVTTAQTWADGSTNSVGMGIRTSPETGTGVHNTLALNTMNGTLSVPYIDVTYDNYPDTAGAPTATATHTYGSTNYVLSTTPTFKARVTDADGGTLSGRFTIKEGATTVVNGATGSSVLSGSYSTYTPPSGTLLTGHTYTVTAVGNDGTVSSKAASAAFTVTVDTSLPTMSSITSSTFPSNAWTGTVQSSGSFTFSASDVGAGIGTWAYNFDNGTTSSVTASGSPQTVSVPTTSGWHTLNAWAVDKAGNESTPLTYTFGNGAGINSPLDNALTDTYVALDGAAPYAATQVRFQYRIAGTSTWNDVPAADVQNNGGALGSWPVSTDQSDPAHVRALAPQLSGGAGPALAWNVGATVTGTEATAQVQVQALFTNGGTTYTTNATTFTLDRTGADTSIAAEDAGPCSVNLLNGACSISIGDAGATALGAGLSVGRRYNSRNASATDYFGPGWSSTLAAGSVDASSLIDSDSYVTIVNGDGDKYYFIKSGSAYVVGDDAEGMTLVKTGSGTSASYVVTHPDGTKSTFAGTTSTGTGPTYAAPWTFVISSEQQAGSATSATFTYDYAHGGRLSQILAPVPAGVSPTCSASTWDSGCRALQLTYNANNEITAVTLKTVDGAGTVKTVDLACYAYETTAPYRLSKEWDPRSTGATCGSPVRPTSYTYDAGTGRITSISPPGLAAWNVHYDGSGRVDYVERQHDSAHGSGTERTSVVYNAAIGATTTTDLSHPDLSATQRAKWGENAAPVTATAVFGPGYTASSTALRDAVVHALDVNGREINVASFHGVDQSGWKVSTTQYDTFGNVVAELSPLNRETALAGSCGEAGLSTGCTTAQEAAALSKISVYSADGVDLTDTYDPVNWSTYSADGDTFYGTARLHTHSTYGTSTSIPADPTTDGPTHSVIKTVKGASLSAQAVSTSETDKRTTVSAYGLSASDTSGWTLHKPMRTTVLVPSNEDIVSESRYDATTGATTEVRQPSAAGTTASAGTTKFSYYTAGTTDNANCVNTAWAGLPCKQSPGAQPTTSGLPKLATTQTTSYDYLGRGTTVVETVVDASGNTQTRTTSATYGGPSGIGDQVITKSVTSTVGTAVPTVTYGYDTSTGLATTVDGTTDPNLGGTMTTGYDDFGRVTSFTDADGASTATTYDSHGQKSTVTNRDASSTVINSATYTYDDAAEHRHLPTAVTYGNSVGTFSAVYNADGAIVEQTFPNGLDQEIQRDMEDRTNWMYYSGSYFVDDAIYYNAHGQVATDNGYTVSSSHQYAYDEDGRLTQVEETRGGSCTTRQYMFDVDSNRLAYYQYPADALNSCSTDTGANRVVWPLYDEADRQYASYTESVGLDAFGRTTSLPESITSPEADTTLGYYVNNVDRTMTQSGVTKTWTIDPAGRDRKMSVSGGSVASLNHYGDETSGSPVWSLETGPTGATSHTVYDLGLDGSLAAVVSDAGGSTPPISYQLQDTHGNITHTSSPTASGSPDGATYDADEFGNQRDATGASTTPPRYGWGGGAQRSGDAEGGLVRMGARVYNPVMGRFLTPDPVLGGEANPYDYPGDPLTESDLSGCATCHDNGRVAHWIEDDINWWTGWFEVWDKGLIRWAYDKFQWIKGWLPEGWGADVEVQHLYEMRGTHVQWYWACSNGRRKNIYAFSTVEKFKGTFKYGVKFWRYWVHSYHITMIIAQYEAAEEYVRPWYT